MSTTCIKNYASLGVNSPGIMSLEIPSVRTGGQWNSMKLALCKSLQRGLVWIINSFLYGHASSRHQTSTKVWRELLWGLKHNQQSFESRNNIVQVSERSNWQRNCFIYSLTTMKELRADSLIPFVSCSKIKFSLHKRRISS